MSKRPISFSVSSEDAQKASSSLSQQQFFLNSDNEDSDAGSSSDKLWTGLNNVNTAAGKPKTKAHPTVAVKKDPIDASDPEEDGPGEYNVKEENMTLFISAMGKISSDQNKTERIKTVYISYLQGALFRIKSRLQRIVPVFPTDPMWIFGIECSDLMYCIARFANTELAISKLMKTGTYINRNILESQRIIAIRQLDQVCTYDYVVKEIKRAIGKYQGSRETRPGLDPVPSQMQSNGRAGREEFVMTGKKPKFGLRVM